MKPEGSKPNQLFTLRLWSETLADGGSEWRGRIHCVGTDEVRHFRDWPGLLPMLLAMLREAERREQADLAEDDKMTR